MMQSISTSDSLHTYFQYLVTHVNKSGVKHYSLKAPSGLPRKFNIPSFETNRKSYYASSVIWPTFWYTLRRAPYKFPNIILAMIEKRLKRKRPRSKPFMFKIEAAYGCNLKCPLCISQKAKQQMPNQKYIKLPEFKKLNDKLGKKAVRMSFYMWGEPMVNPHITDMVKMAAKSRVYTYFSSNFTLASPEKVRALVDAGLGGVTIPLDGWTQEQYAHYRVGGDVEKVKAGLSQIMEYKRSQKKRYPEVNLAVIRFDHIKDDMDKIRQFADDINVDSYTEKPNLEHAPVYTSAIPYSKCFWPWYTMYIDTDGSVYPCVGYQREPAGKEKRWDFGNIYTDSLDDIWHGSNLVRIRKFLTAKDKLGYTEEDIPCIRCPRYC